MTEKQFCDREFDFALVLSGVSELSDDVMDALFAAGCDDATPSITYGRVWMEFSRSAPSLKDAILSAIRDIRSAGIGADVSYVDECDLLTQAEIARRIEKSRQYVSQLINGQRGPGGFPPPVCQLSADAPLWQWCAVSQWLFENNHIRREAVRDADTVAAINAALSMAHQRERNPDLVEEVSRAVAACPPCGEANRP